MFNAAELVEINKKQAERIQELEKALEFCQKESFKNHTLVQELVKYDPPD
jgi:hypothetical protein